MATQELELAVKRIIRLNGDGAIKAFCDVAVAGSYLIKGVKVVDGKNGLFVSMPREQGKNGQWYETVVPLTKEAREQLSHVVLEAFGTQEPSLD
jgi:stage V sporulation protein G